jgi:hypothetical protein
MTRCPKCNRARGWLCDLGRPCGQRTRKRAARMVPTKRRDHREISERVRRYWLRKYGLAA